jgi:F-type H+-transporting ATPase subunit delta
MISKIISHYAKGLIQLSQSHSQLEQHLNELEQFVQLMKEAPALEHFLAHPFIKPEEKKKVLKSILGDGVDLSLLHFLFFLIDRKRIQYLNAILEDYRRLAYDRLGIVDVQVVTAVSMEKKMSEKIQNKLEAFYRKRVQIKEKIDPMIIGGMILMIANQMLDNSVKNRLMQLKENLLAVNV